MLPKRMIQLLRLDKIKGALHGESKEIFMETGSNEIKPEIKKTIQEQTYDPDRVLKIIKEEGGRSTQRDIRKKIPLSEAKVSLMISELEAKGKIQKIKKGRGNIIVLK